MVATFIILPWLSVLLYIGTEVQGEAKEDEGLPIIMIQGNEGQ